MEGLYGVNGSLWRPHPEDIIRLTGNIADHGAKTGEEFIEVPEYFLEAEWVLERGAAAPEGGVETGGVVEGGVFILVIFILLVSRSHPSKERIPGGGVKRILNGGDGINIESFPAK